MEMAIPLRVTGAGVSMWPAPSPGHLISLLTTEACKRTAARKDVE